MRHSQTLFNEVLFHLLFGGELLWRSTAKEAWQSGSLANALVTESVLIFEWLGALKTVELHFRQLMFGESRLSLLEDCLAHGTIVLLF